MLNMGTLLTSQNLLSKVKVEPCLFAPRITGIPRNIRILAEIGIPLDCFLI